MNKSVFGTEIDFLRICCRKKLCRLLTVERILREKAAFAIFGRLHVSAQDEIASALRTATPKQ